MCYVFEQTVKFQLNTFGSFVQIQYSEVTVGIFSGQGDREWRIWWHAGELYFTHLQLSFENKLRHLCGGVNIPHFDSFVLRCRQEQPWNEGTADKSCYRLPMSLNYGKMSCGISYVKRVNLSTLCRYLWRRRKLHAKYPSEFVFPVDKMPFDKVHSHRNIDYQSWTKLHVPLRLRHSRQSLSLFEDDSQTVERFCKNKNNLSVNFQV